MAEWEQAMTDAGLLSSCYAVAMGMDDNELFAAIADDDFKADPWSALYADDYEMDVAQDDGTTKKQTINEWSGIAGAFEEGATAAVYLAGTKYQFCNRDVQDDVTVVLVKRTKGGGVLTKTSNGYYIIGLYDEEKEQVVGNAISAIVAYAQYMAST